MYNYSKFLRMKFNDSIGTVAFSSYSVNPLMTTIDFFVEKHVSIDDFSLYQLIRLVTMVM